MIHPLAANGTLFWVLGSAPTGFRREEIPLVPQLAEKSGPGRI
jgi:hypothetical protein